MLQVNGFGLLVLHIMLLKNGYSSTKKLKDKAILHLKQYCLSCYVALSNVF